MIWSLPAGLSFCESHGRLVFLDSVRDRYLCLPEPEEAVFRRLMAGEIIQGAPSSIPPQLAAAGLLLENMNGNPLTPCTATLPRASLDKPLKPDSKHMPGLVLMLMRAATALRVRGLDRTLGALQRRRIATPSDDAYVRLCGIAAAFDRLGLFATPHEQCLIRAIALGAYLRRRGIAVDVVLGARLRPFSAHAWVQYGNVVVNDDIDTVATFTPIRVV